MTNPDSTNELTLRIKTGFIVATGIGALVYTPIFVVGIFVILLAFIGSLEFTEMLSKGNRNRIIKIPKWFLPGTSVLMGFGVLNGELWLHITLILSALCWTCFELVFTKKNKLLEFTSLGFGLFGMLWIVWSILHVALIKSIPEGSNLLLLLILVISLSDVAAYFGG